MGHAGCRFFGVLFPFPDASLGPDPQPNEEHRDKQDKIIFAPLGTGQQNRRTDEHRCPFWLFCWKNRWRFLVYLVVESSTRETHLFPLKGHLCHWVCLRFRLPSRPKMVGVKWQAPRLAGRRGQCIVHDMHIRTHICIYVFLYIYVYIGIGIYIYALCVRINHSSGHGR